MVGAIVGAGQAAPDSAHPVIQFTDEMILRLSGTERQFQDAVCPKLLYTLKTPRSDVLAKLHTRKRWHRCQQD
jgi:hypothetical protein